MAAILLPTPLLRLLTALTHPSGAPHTALLLSLPAGGSVVASHSCPTEPPFPRAALDGEEQDDDARARCYAALAGGCWADQQGQQDDGKEPVMLETELGRLALTQLGGFLLVLVGNEVAPWKVLDKKIRAAAVKLREPLEKVAA
ncbi:hypothetical protein JCM10213_002209 [Rhodosporidiobolus nylandii]